MVSVGKFKKWVKIVLARRKINKAVKCNRSFALKRLIEENPSLKDLVEHYSESFKNEKA